MSFFTDLDIALNPLNLSKIDTKRLIQESRAKLVSLNNTINLLLSTQENLVRRMHEIELMTQTPAIYTTIIGESNEGDVEPPLKQSTIKRKRKGSVKHLKKKKVQFQMPTQTKLMKRTEQMESESEELDEMKSEDEEARTLLHHPVLEPQQTGHARMLELNHQRRKNERGMIASTRPRLKTKPSLTLIPANLKISKVQKSRAPHPPQFPEMKVEAETHSE